MHPVTKVFVVLMVILAVVMVSLVIPFVANVETYRDQRDSALLERDSARIDVATAQAAAQVSRTELNNQLDQQKAIVATKDGEIAKLRGDLSNAEGALERTRADLARTQADIANLTASHKLFADIQATLQAELGTRREEVTKLSKQIIELEAANADLESSRAALNRQVRLAREQLVGIQEELNRYQEELKRIPPSEREKWAGNKNADLGSTPGEEPPVPIRGQITDVRQLGEDTTLVQLNVGSVSGVKERMKFRLHRGEEYLGTLIIMKVDEQQAAGRVSLLKGGAAIRTGDEALAGPIR